jgi:F-type H+-transporting ATPase subunit gamma
LAVALAGSAAAAEAAMNAQIVMTLLSSVTVPVCAQAAPHSILASVFSVMLARARRRILVEHETHQDRAEVTALHLFYNRPTSGAVYAPVLQRLLPLDDTWRRELAELPWPTKPLPEVMGDSATLRALIREYLFVTLFRACAESLASENASRLAAMERADRNIDDLLKDLNGNFHRLRQSGIDAELFDVISGFEALARPRQA